MAATSFMSKLVSILTKIKIIQTGNKVQDYIFTAIWCLIGLIGPVLSIVLRTEEISKGLTGSFVEVLSTTFLSLSKPISHFFLIPSICIIGVNNPDFVTDQALKMPTRTIFYIVCFLQIITALVQYLIRDFHIIVDSCYNSAECGLKIVEIQNICQYVFYRTLSLTIVGLCSKQVITSFESNAVSFSLVVHQINLYKNMKSGLSALLFFVLSYEIFNSIYLSFMLIYGDVDTMKIILTIFSFSMVFYYCLTLDDCFSAYKDHIVKVR